MHCFVYILNLADRSHEIYRRQRESYKHHTINCTAKRVACVAGVFNKTPFPFPFKRLPRRLLRELRLTTLHTTTHVGAAKKGTLNQAKH